MRSLLAETIRVCVLAMPLTCQKYWTSELCPFFLSTCCALLSLISWQQVESRHVPIREWRYCSEVFSSDFRKSALIAMGHLPAVPSSYFVIYFTTAHFLGKHCWVEPSSKCIQCYTWNNICISSSKMQENQLNTLKKEINSFYNWNHADCLKHLKYYWLFSTLFGSFATWVRDVPSDSLLFILTHILDGSIVRVWRDD